jgi:hypothetical protein
LRYVETEALLAVLEGDDFRCQELLSEMLPNELNELQYAVGRLRSLTVSAYQQSRGQRTDDPGGWR